MGHEAGQVLGQWLQRARGERGLSQEELAARSGLSVRTIGNVERGRTRPHPRSVRVLSDTLGLPRAAADDLVALYRASQNSGPDACLPQAEHNADSAVPDARGQSPETAAGAVVLPRQLPAVVTHFVGRSAELKILDGLLGPALDSPGPPSRAEGVAAISGTAGIGKSTLAVHWAHQVADRFPDGQLYANLHGFDQVEPPAAPGEVIRVFLGSLQVPASQLPLEAEAQAGLYRSLLTGRRMLIVLDNARDAAQVQQLLPGAPGCLVVVTSRSQLAGLATTRGAQLVRLDTLSADNAAELLACRLGKSRVAAEPKAAQELAGLCGGLPLALAITAARAAARPQFPLAVLAEGLRDEHGRLDALEADGEAASSIRTVFSWSCQSLPAPAAALFRMLGLHPGPNISAAAAASLAGLDIAQAGKLLSCLTSACLITEYAPGRYGLHDLLRAYAAEQARTLDPAAARQAAIGRVLDYYLHTAAAADRLLHPQRDPVSPDLPQPGAAPGAFADYGEAIAWFEAEHEVLLAAVALAARERFDTHAWQLPWALAAYLDRQAHWHDWKTVQQVAVAAAGRTGDKTAQAHAYRGLGHVCVRQGDYQDGYGYLAHALGLYRGLGHHLGQARVHHDIAWCYGQQGCHQRAMLYSQQSLRLARTAGHRAAEALALNAVGWYSAHLGNHQLALASCQQALEIQRELRNRFEQAIAHDSLGYAYERARNHVQALAFYHHALSLYRDLDDRYQQALTLAHLGDTCHAAMLPQAAMNYRRQALTILEDLRHPDAAHIRSVLRNQHATVNSGDD